MALKTDLLRAAFMTLGIVPILALALISHTLALLVSPLVLLVLCVLALAVPWPEADIHTGESGAAASGTPADPPMDLVHTR